MSQDLTFFLHTHPERLPDADFHIDVHFPKPGMYRVLSDFYPSGGTPQLIANTVMIPGEGFSLQPAHIQADMSPQTIREFPRRDGECSRARDRRGLKLP